MSSPTFRFRGANRGDDTGGPHIVQQHEQIRQCGQRERINDPKRAIREQSAWLAAEGSAAATQ